MNRWVLFETAPPGLARPDSSEPRQSFTKHPAIHRRLTTRPRTATKACRRKSARVLRISKSPSSVNLERLQGGDSLDVSFSALATQHGASRHSTSADLRGRFGLRPIVSVLEGPACMSRSSGKRPGSRHHPAALPWVRPLPAKRPVVSGASPACRCL